MPMFQSQEQRTFYQNKFFKQQLALPAPEQVTNVNSPFNKARKGTARTVHRMMNNVNKTLTMKTARFTGDKVYNTAVRTKKIIGKASVPFKKIGHGLNVARRAIPGPVRKLGVTGMFVGAAAAMVGVGMMRGAMNAAQDIMSERYLQDQRKSRNILMQTRVGYSHGSARMDKYGQTNGLAQALHQGRHGRY